MIVLCLLVTAIQRQLDRDRATLPSMNPGHFDHQIFYVDGILMSVHKYISQGDFEGAHPLIFTQRKQEAVS